MKRSLTYLTVFLFVAVGFSFAQSKAKLNPIAIENLVTGIHSENLGLQKSSIFFAGSYKIEETVDALREEMLSNENPSIKILAALALYEIHNEDALDDLERLVRDVNQDYHIRRMAKAICDEWYIRNSNAITVAK